jgi:hypothetical protein
VIDAWAPLGLISITAALLALPVTPALYELRKRSDAAPLPTSRHDGRIGNFAEAFHSRLEPLRRQLEQSRLRGQLVRTVIDGMEVLLAGADDFDFDPSLLNGIAAIWCSGDAHVPGGRVVEADVCANHNVRVGEGAAIRAALAKGDLTLERNSASLRWLHADGSIAMCQGSVAYGRLSARQSIFLEPGCGFQHIYAPRILTLESDRKSQLIRPDIGHDFSGGTPFTSRERIRVYGDFVLPAGETMNANVIATGDLRFGEGSRFFGSAKSYKDTLVQANACVYGSIVCGGTVHLGLGCFVGGPVMAERDVLIDRGVRVGTLHALTTISSCRAQIATGCQLHGTVWARVCGNIEA